MQTLFELAARQHGVFSLAQAATHDITERRLRTLIAAGIVESTLPGVHRVVGSPTTWLQRVQAATLWLPGSLASHRAAASLHRMRGADHVPVEILVERWSRRHRPADILVHETKDLVASDIGEVGLIPCTTVVRTLVDLPAVTHDVRAGEAIDGATKYDPTLLSRLTRRHLEVARRGRNGTVRLRRLLEQRQPGEVVDSAFERMALDLFASSGLPRPVTQHKVQSGEIVAYLDLSWPERMLAVECDSYEHHRTVRAFQWDRARRRHLAGLGWLVLEFTYDEVKNQPAMVVATVRRHLEVRRDRSA